MDDCVVLVGFFCKSLNAGDDCGATPRFRRPVIALRGFCEVSKGLEGKLLTQPKVAEPTQGGVVVAGHVGLTQVQVSLQDTGLYHVG